MNLCLCIVLIQDNIWGSIEAAEIQKSQMSFVWCQFLVHAKYMADKSSLVVFCQHSVLCLGVTRGSDNDVRSSHSL
jgi:hypothetical protein